MIKFDSNIRNLSNQVRNKYFYEISARPLKNIAILTAFFSDNELIYLNDSVIK